ncbi:carotenoid biosynthesis protein [Halovivax gelatinilyticus]|uniref:carotenoid biosynthesis protein n=1 Tax=Halovivax gelatinilyticus TaxID=2961597 RepID=UPI0020CA70BC|nr:carotenoid biosynthesis protein [Halovivax gelatinilyticus]
MTDGRVFAILTTTLGLVALIHALATWPIEATVALFLGGAIVAFVGEYVVIRIGWLEHHVGPFLLGVPLYVLFGWTATVYVAFRVSLVVTPGVAAILLAGILATTYDVLTDHRGVEDGHWTYTDGVPGPRFREVPWWNFAGWFVISTGTAALAYPFL